MLQRMVLEGMKKGKKEFVFMDIGAGNFEWGKEVARIFNENPLFTKEEIKISIYSLRGEQNTGKEVIDEGICRLYEYGNFKIENLEEEFTKRKQFLGDKRKQFLGDKVDMIVSSWSLRHLVDPTGTLLQAYALLKPESGIVCFDGFFAKVASSESNEVASSESNERDIMFNLLENFGTPFFVKEDTGARRNNCFIMRKSCGDVALGLQYNSTVLAEKLWKQVGSGFITSFTKTKEWQETCVGDYQKRGDIYHRLFNLKKPGYDDFCSYVISDFSAILKKISEIFSASTDNEDDLKYVAKAIGALLSPFIRDMLYNKAMEEPIAKSIEDLLTKNPVRAAAVINLILKNDISLLRHALKHYFSSKEKKEDALIFKLIGITELEVLNAVMPRSDEEIGVGKTLLQEAEERELSNVAMAINKRSADYAPPAPTGSVHKPDWWRINLRKVESYFKKNADKELIKAELLSCIAALFSILKANNICVDKGDPKTFAESDLATLRKERQLIEKNVIFKEVQKTISSDPENAKERFKKVLYLLCFGDTNEHKRQYDELAKKLEISGAEPSIPATAMGAPKPPCQIPS